MTRTALLLGCLLGLSGCAASAVFVGANMATLMHGKKTIPDFAVSAQKKQNCSLLHASRNEPYCQPTPADTSRQALAVMAESRYCYRTLGGVSCYDRPDYVASSQTRVDFAAGYVPEPQGPLAPPEERLAPLAILPSAGGY